MTAHTTPAAPAPHPGRWGRIPAWWLDHPELDADGLAVLAALSTYADDSGVCWPSQATLAGKLKRSRPTVNRILGRLDALGLVAIEHRRSANGGRLSCRYRLALTPATDPQGAGTRSGGGAGVDSPADSAMDSPCPAASQEQPEPEQIPDSLDQRADGGTGQPIAAQTVAEDWVPTAADRRWAEARFPAADIDRHAERFVQQCRAHGYRYRDAGAAWRSWLLQDMARLVAPAGSATDRAAGNRGRKADRTAVRPTPSRSAEAEQRLSAWASVAARLNGDAGSGAMAPTAAGPWVRA
ncbi:helix-turn-helix domain-containing protein [Azospirillum sp. TSO35-2]|uniref:helix-turn-helix domain-containing protein n=1 Tax=Azospirillum sp. TSO35-2 TaxID=716796 RepID=UPI000D61BD43|nr:helix-turn-helix domain-containing protein [Azospirillum sp. TSO35-2]PWC34058.1 hypothetical protein TSO352_27455 [Azospirillum sp. TSO35-2]